MGVGVSVDGWLRVAACACVASGCAPAPPPPVAVAVRVRAPAIDDRSCAGVDTGAGLDAGPASGASVLARVFRPGPRCVVFAAASFDAVDGALRAVAVRTREITAPANDVPPCFGPQGAVLLSGLDPRSEYQLELAIYDDGDFVAPEVVPPRPRIVSRQNLRWVDTPDAGLVCLGAFRCAPVYEQVTLRARALCPAAPELPRCSLDAPFAGRCSLP